MLIGGIFSIFDNGLCSAEQPWYSGFSFMCLDASFLSESGAERIDLALRSRDEADSAKLGQTLASNLNLSVATNLPDRGLLGRRSFRYGLELVSVQL